MTTGIRASAPHILRYGLRRVGNQRLYKTGVRLIQFSPHTPGQRLPLLSRGISNVDVENRNGEESEWVADLAQNLRERNVDRIVYSLEDSIFDVFCDKDEKISVAKFLNALTATGLRLTDPRLKECIGHFESLECIATDLNEVGTSLTIDRETFKECIADNIVLIARALQGKFIIPDFKTQFSRLNNKLYTKCKPNNKGKVATYIPQLSRVNPDYWGVSSCTIDGQRHSVGDVHVPFCLQSCSKPLLYALAQNEMSAETIHQYVGQEPSGRSFNELTLDYENKPHNPMINAGAIVVSSLLKNENSLSDRFDFAHKQFQKLSGGEFVGFNNAVFLSERETADRNFALAYYMKEKKCFPEGTNLMETLDFYFQMCSIEITCESGSVMAATLANGGVCPITGDKVLNPVSVRNTLCLMASCGMYDYSGQFAFQCGIPAKSGVSGAILVVVPNVMGLCLWSPPLDNLGNSVRGIQFAKEFVNTFHFHNFDSMVQDSNKHDPRRKRFDSKAMEITRLLYAAYNGDVTALRRCALINMDLAQGDYDLRTALHVAAAEGHQDVIQFLLERCQVPCNPKDRWGFTPLDEARRFNHPRVAEMLEAAIKHEERDAGRGEEKLSLQND
ncbi:glutaminase kidney isoform, mitochondrial [Lingula anatina]|uniref:glutaminase n=1 Tax=Lingula anatina TaxID=7574 RepID=A0A1S3IUW0_LINAN|nr:glutaminase kidney isoform, mitochondrial [Lingula anatina]|eukprot:XP_013401990.1 glutaminase kidney isoform, mitochondrial [Lingula anatina]